MSEKTIPIALLLFAGILANSGGLEVKEIVSKTWEELKDAGWETVQVNSSVAERPSTLYPELTDLDAFVNGGQVWINWESINHVSSYSLTSSTSNICGASWLRLGIGFYSKNATLTVLPCKTPSSKALCDFAASSDITWSLKTVDIQTDNWQAESPITILVNIQPGSQGYVIFNNVSIWHDGVPCTTEVPTTVTTSPPECGSTTLPPEPCDCCDRCGKGMLQEQAKEVHYHYHYYYGKAGDEEM